MKFLENKSMIKWINNGISNHARGMHPTLLVLYPPLSNFGSPLEFALLSLHKLRSLYHYQKPSTSEDQYLRISFQGPRCFRKQRQPRCWSTGIIPPPLEVSMASNRVTTSSISGLRSGLASQHRFITLASELGQHLGISGLKFWKKRHLRDKRAGKRLSG